MSVRSHVVIPSVDDRLRPNANLEHGGAQHVTGVVRFDLQLLVHLRHLWRSQS
jgi:hypothetical protein